MKILIAYFSRSGENYVSGEIVNLPVGNTEVAAGMIQALTGADTFRIDTVKAYPSGYHETTEVAQHELHEDARPELKSHPTNMSEYGVVILGYPNWWGTMPMAAFTFLEKHDLSGKMILPFCTHEGSGLGHSCADIKKLCPGATLLKGLAVRGGSVRAATRELSTWLKEAGVMPDAAPAAAGSGLRR